MRNKEDILIKDLLLEEMAKELLEQREFLRNDAKKNNETLQSENRKTYNRRRKKASLYKEGDLVAIQRTQFGAGLKLRLKFLGPYKVTKVNSKDRYEVEKTARGGRVRSTTPAEDRYIVLSAKRNRRTTAQQVANQFLASSGKQISRKTVARRLRGGGLYARRPVVCVPLTRQHRTARLQWCREHHNWTEQDWACVLFSDESRFSLSTDCRRQLIWREIGTAYRPENIQEKDRYPTCSIMVWAGIMINGRTHLHVVANGTMTGQRYTDEVLLPQDCLDSEGIQRLVWPARSPDLNPIENVWDAMERQVAGRNYPPTNRNTLIRALTEEWDKLPQHKLPHCWIMLCKVCGFFKKRSVMFRRKQRSAFDQVSKFDRARIVSYRDCRLSFRKIGSRVGRNQTTVMRICDRWMGTKDRRGRSYPPQCTTSCDDRRPLLGLPLTQSHRRLRHQWCDKRRMWVAEWNKVVFTDESRICLHNHDGRI
ncbi:transposable element Tcb2 transposase [Trichonephila clavipes]|nr:transposable element Tcb2 transposase [Trichonephila clavipes]